MKTKVLMIGNKETIQKVKLMNREFSQFILIPLVDHLNIKQTLKKFPLNHIDCVIVINQISISEDISLILKGIPVFYMKYSITDLYKTLFTCLLNQSEQKSSPIKLSVDFFYEEEIRKRLHEEGIQTNQLFIKEHHPDTNVRELIDFHKTSIKDNNVKAVVTSHPYVVDSLNNTQVEIYLVTPTNNCIRTFLFNVSKKMTQELGYKRISTFPIRYESDTSLENFKKLGMSGATIYKLYCLCDSIGSNRITAAELANGFAITLRSARRILTTLENHGVAKVVGEEQLNGRGRPRYVYHIDFNQLNEEALSVPVVN